MNIMVLEDGETYSGIGGCHIIEVPDGMDPDDLEIQLDAFMRSDQDATEAFRIMCGFTSDGEPIPYVDEVEDEAELACEDCGGELYGFNNGSQCPGCEAKEDALNDDNEDE